MIMNVYFYFPRGLFLAFKYNVGIKQVSLHSLHKSTYLFCGAEWLPGRWTGRRRRTEPTAASCWLSSHTDRLTQMNITTVGENAPTGVFWHLTCTAFIHCFHFSVLSSLLTSTLFSLSLSLSLLFFSFLFLCVCVLRSGLAVWALIWKSSGFWVAPALLAGLVSQRLADSFTGRLVQLLSDSPTDWITVTD